MIKKIKMRTLLIGGVITLFFALLIGRVFYLQVIDNEFWQERAMANWNRKETLIASRGTITDRDGDILAMDAPTYTVTLNPKVIHENDLVDDVVDGLKRALGKSDSEIRKLATAKADGEYRVYREIRNNDEEQKDQVLALKEKLEMQLKKAGKIADSGISVVTEKKRYYPRMTLAAHLLGFTDRQQGAAVAGFEKYFDDQLKGVNGFAKYQSDKKGVKVPSADEVYQPPKNGKNFKLTIDDTIQYYIEDAMREAYEQYNPVSMTVIAADPNTMEILGMANMPTFDPNTYWEYDVESYRNHAVSSTYEPGSTFKIVTLASAIQEKLFNPDATYKSGSIKAGGRTHRDIEAGGWGEITFLEGVKRSSNVAFVKLGYEMLGKERLKNYINAFGFSERTGIDLPGEGLGRMNMEKDIDISTVPYGYAVSVTPIQQLAAISAVANGGKLMKPQIVKEIEDPNTGEKTIIEPELIRQVISPETSRKTSEYLEQVVADQEKGTGHFAYIEGYRVAGKTGTAVKGDYSDNSKAVVSFIGYAPVDDPKIAVLVIIDEPNEKVGGGRAAAPVFQKIVSQTLKHWGVPKSQSQDKQDKQDNKKKTNASNLPKVADLADMKVSEVKAKLLAEGIAFETLGQGSTVKKQYPPPGASMTAGQKIYLLTEEGTAMKIPNLKGESLRDAMEVLTLMKVRVQVQGEGYVSEQKEITEKGQRVVYLTLQSAADTVKEAASAETGEETDGAGQDKTEAEHE
ncbi:penicillin-binding transpeptidase domain-containing protein [Paenibacillus dakarensis]|uniref:penicillin-binding transpeptidase domain-containing protein n=1 Tax=Paenibacillus dakarensis TaxID=1527293 RepID=UPI0006D589A3|nr:penicillin-binding transpeptidase domain-containing protein [Paenibacillus dakarensis]